VDGSVTTTTWLPLLGRATVSLGKLFSLKDSPNVCAIAAKAQKQGVKIDRWYSPFCVDSQGHSLSALVFYAPPYTNVNMGFIWIDVSCNVSTIRAIEAPLGKVLASLGRVQFHASSDPEVKQICRP
jgi:hypothetical protein